MSKRPWTPAPWRLKVQTYGLDMGGNHSEIYRVCAHRGIQVGAGHSRERGEAYHNALLMSLAPEMIDLLEDFVCDNQVGYDQDLIRRAEDILRKARGVEL